MIKKILICAGVTVFQFIAMASAHREGDEKQVLLRQSLEYKPSNYGNLGRLPKDILFNHILPRCGLVSIKLNKAFFTAGTGYEPEDISKIGPDYLPTYSCISFHTKITLDFSEGRSRGQRLKERQELHRSVIQNVNDKELMLDLIRFNKMQAHPPETDFNKIPSYILYGLVNEAIHIPIGAWDYIKHTQIRKFVSHGPGREFLPRYPIGEAFAQPLSMALKISNVHTLILPCHKIGNKGIKYIVGMITDEKSKIHSLDLWNNKIGPEGFKILAGGLPHSKIHTLTMRANIIHKSFKFFVGSLSNIQFLDLSTTKFGDEDMEILVEMLPKSLFHTLYLANNEISDVGIEILSKVLPLCKLHTLKLSYNKKMTKKGIKILADVLYGGPALRLLILSGNKMDDECARYLIEKLQHKRICAFQISTDNLSQDTLTQFRNLTNP